MAGLLCGVGGVWDTFLFQLHCDYSVVKGGHRVLNLAWLQHGFCKKWAGLRCSPGLVLVWLLCRVRLGFWCEAHLFIPQGRIPSFFCIAPGCGTPCLGWGPWWDCVSISPTCLDMPLLSFVLEILFAWLSGTFKRKIIIYIAVNLLYPEDEVSSASSYASNLNWNL